MGESMAGLKERSLPAKRHVYYQDSEH